MVKQSLRSKHATKQQLDDDEDYFNFQQTKKQKNSPSKKDKPIQKQSKKPHNNSHEKQSKQAQKQSFYDENQRSSQQRQENRSRRFISEDIIDDEIEDTKIIFLEFFNSIEQSNGLVFRQDTRKKLQKKHPEFHFTNEHDLDPEGEEVEKIKVQMRNLLIFMQSSHQTGKIKMKFEEYIKEDVEKMIEQFRGASWIFCKEVTHELFSILRKICNIIIEFRNPQCQSHYPHQDTGMEIKKKNKKMIQKLREFGNKIASQNDRNHEYFFFGYKFLEPQKPKAQNQVRGNKKQKYILDKKYREPNTEFAKLTEKIGIHLFRVLTGLRCYETVKCMI